MNILVLCHAYPNYVPDLLLHGLRKLFGDAVVDFPRKEVLYQGLCGSPNVDPIPNLMSDDSGVDRTDLEAKLAAGFFSFVICDVRAFNEQIALLQKSICPLAIIDGEDKPAPIRPGPYAILRRETDGHDYSIPLPMALPVEVLDWLDRHADQPKTHSVGFLGARINWVPERNDVLDEVGRCFPDALFHAWELNDEQQRKGRDAYYASLQSCRAVLSLPGYGYDTFRYWEHAACNAAHFAMRMPFLIPHDFRDGLEVVRFTSVRELVWRIEEVVSDDQKWRALAARSRAWLRAHHTTEQRARQTIDRLKVAFGV
ncbi:glycosyltransferase [Telmatospirillum sp.]|uniref:glycosyltransferase n=1 Tax=Telmatospirillum sp. TaxID=2079197 RepID=UPI00284FF507|nr:glycosyltransferase [Telmatospirillum sp.]MDR3441043.1 glycosyltransferase [Telmatospirillum sp.]